MSASARRPSLSHAPRATHAVSIRLAIRWEISRRALASARPDLAHLLGPTRASANPWLEWRLELPPIDGAGDRAPDHAATDPAAPESPAELDTTNAGAAAELVFPGGHRLTLLHVPPHEIGWIELDPRVSGERRVEVRILGGRGLVAVLSVGEHPALRYAATPLLVSALGLGGGCYEPPSVRLGM